MNNTLRFSLIFVGAAICCFCFFYFYPAHVFEAEVKGALGSIVVDLSLENIIYKKNLPEGLILENIQSIQLTFKGYLILFICILGLPLMLAYRSVVKNSHSDEEE